MLKQILLSFILLFFLHSTNAITLFDPKRGIETTSPVKVKEQNTDKGKVIPLYMQLVGITKINNNIQFKLFDMQLKKNQIVNWNPQMKNQIILKDFYKIDRIEYANRTLILIPKIEVQCQEKKELNLSCNEKNEFVLKLMRNKTIASEIKTKTIRHNTAKHANNPFAKAIINNNNKIK